MLNVEIVTMKIGFLRKIHHNIIIPKVNTQMITKLVLVKIKMSKVNLALKLLIHQKIQLLCYPNFKSTKK